MQLKPLWFAPLPAALAAQALGHVAEAGLEVMAERTRSSDQQYDALMAGSVDAVVTAMDNVMIWNRRAADADLCIVAQVEATTRLTLMARPEYATLADLRGARLLVDSPHNGFVIALRAMLADAGLGEGAYEMVPAGGVTERLDALVGEQGDATLLGPPFEDMALAAGCHSLGRVNDIWPHFPGQGLVVRASRLAELLPALRAWFGAMDRACGWIAGHEAEARALIGGGGLPGPAVDAMLAAIPASWTPSRAGVDLLIAQRRQLGLPGADSRFEDLVSEIMWAGA